MNILISYGDDRFRESVKRLKRQGRHSGRFDKIIMYSYDDLPDYIRSSPLMAFSRGGGFWVWKPYIIYQTLLKCQEGDVVYYLDAGCSINKDSSEWDVFQELMKSNNAIFFKYRSAYEYPGWREVCSREENCSPQIVHWMSPACVEFFARNFGNEDFLTCAKIWCGAIIIKRTSPLLAVLEEWYRITLFHPNLVIDPFGGEQDELPDTFNVHRHDQAILTPLVWRYQQHDGLCILDETAESAPELAAIRADRWRQARFSSLALRIKYWLWRMLHGKSCCY